MLPATMLLLITYMSDAYIAIFVYAALSGNHLVYDLVLTLSIYTISACLITLHRLVQKWTAAIKFGNFGRNFNLTDTFRLL